MRGIASKLNSRLTGCRLALVFCLGLLQAQGQAAQSSELSRWLMATLSPGVSDALARHPRYRGRTVAVVNRGEDALGDAIAVVLRSALVGQSDILLVEPAAHQPPVAGKSIDDLPCRDTAGSELRLGISVREDRSRGDRVVIALAETDSGAGESPRYWQWSGTLTRSERSRAREPGMPVAPDGSLEAPWGENDVAAAAGALSRDFACSLRPAIAHRLRLQWAEDVRLPPVFRDTVNTSLHLLGGYPELALVERQGDYLVRAEIRPFRGDVYQLWLSGRPQVPLRDPVQAVTYFNVAGLHWPSAQEQVTFRLPDGSAEDYLRVSMLGARQADRGRSAELRVALRLENRAQWPIAYALRLSGGHFMHCIASASYYRHDRFGTLTGTLAPGASEVRDLVVDRLRHVPLPWFGPARCAGSTDLDAFENYATQGSRVTDYVRWDL